MKKRYWVSWWTSAELADTVETPFTAWITGYKFEGDSESSCMCAMVNACLEDAIYSALERYYPGYELRFCNERAVDATPSDRFPLPEGESMRTSLSL